MNYIDLKDKSLADLTAMLKEKKLELFTLNAKQKTMQLTNTSELRVAKKTSLKFKQLLLLLRSKGLFMPKRQITGTVIKKAGDKTATVLVERRVLHPRYHKTVKRFKKYLIHDEKNDINVGDTVSAVECRPLSKTKSFRLLEIVKRGEA